MSRASKPLVSRTIHQPSMHIRHEAAECRYQVRSTKYSKKLSVEAALGAGSSILLVSSFSLCNFPCTWSSTAKQAYMTRIVMQGLGTFFLLLYTGVYV